MVAEALERVRRTRIGGRFLRLTGAANLFDLYRQASCWTQSAEDAVEALAHERPSQAVVSEYREAELRLADREQSASLSFPREYAVEQETSRALFELVRLMRPARVLEIGVANGVSSHFILSALDLNGMGRLVSVDVDASAGRLVASHPRWDLRIHDPSRATQQLGQLAAEGPMDVVFHDAMHDYAGQYRDFLAVEPALRPGCVFLCDDIEWSNAFSDLCKAKHSSLVVLFDRRKALGGFVC